VFERGTAGLRRERKATFGSFRDTGASACKGLAPCTRAARRLRRRAALDGEDAGRGYAPVCRLLGGAVPSYWAGRHRVWRV